MTELILIRHGLTAWNREARFQGMIDIALDAQGHDEARRAAGRVAVLAAQREVSAVYSSRLSRARDTAVPIAAALGLSVVALPGIEERHYGSFEGKTPEELQRDWGPEFARWRARELDYELPGGGESLRGFHRRIVDALEGLAQRHPSQRVVVVTHGGVLDCVWRIAARVPLEEPWRHKIRNASLNTIVRVDDGWQVGAWADVAHLED